MRPKTPKHFAIIALIIVMCKIQFAMTKRFVFILNLPIVRQGVAKFRKNRNPIVAISIIYVMGLEHPANYEFWGFIATLFSKNEKESQKSMKFP